MTACAAALLLASMLAGCQTASVKQSVVERVWGSDWDNQLEFWPLAAETVTNNDDAFHGVRLYFEGKDDAENYAARVKALQSRGLLPRDFNQPAHQALGRGTLAFALVKALDLQGGLNMRLLGVTPRFAVKEREFRGIYPASSPNQALTGGDFSESLARCRIFEPVIPPISCRLPDTAREFIRHHTAVAFA
jgi:hypothetical protein